LYLQEEIPKENGFSFDTLIFHLNCLFLQLAPVTVTGPVGAAFQPHKEMMNKWHVMWYRNVRAL